MKKIIAVDFYDLIWKAENPFSRDDMDALFCKYAEYGVDAVLWRVSVCGKLLYHSQTPDRYMGCKAQNSTGEKAMAVMRQYDPAEVVVAMGKKYGIEVYFWLTLFDDASYAGFSEMESSICKAHPEYSWQSRDGKTHYLGVLSYAFPEVVEFRLRQIRELAGYGGAGIYLCNRTHFRSPVIREAMNQAGLDQDNVNQWCREHSDLIRSEYVRCRGQFGFDQPALAAYQGDLNDIVAWQHHRGAYFTEFMKKARVAANPGKMWMGLRYGANLGPYIYGDHFFDWKKFSDGSITDALAYDLQPPDYDREEDFPEFYQRTVARKLLWMSLSMNNPEKLLDAYAKSLERWKPFMDGIILFEAYQMTNNPSYWHFLKAF